MKSYFRKYFPLFFTLTILSLMCSHAQAQSTPKPTVQKMSFRDEKGSEFKATFVSYKNHLGELEVRIEAAAIPRFAANINPLLGFGRDTDQNGKIDTWFLITKNGIDAIEIEGVNNLGEDVLGQILIAKYRSSFTMYVTSATAGLLNYVLFSSSSTHQIQEEYYRDWMDLEELRLGFERDYNEMGSSYTLSQYYQHNQLLSIGYKEIAKRMDNFGKRTYWGLALADVGLWLTGSVVLEWGGKVLMRIGSMIPVPNFANAIKETFFSFIEKQKAVVENRLKNVKEKINQAKISLGMKTAEKELIMALTVATWKQSLTYTIKSHKIKKRLRIALKKSIKWPMKVVNGVKTEWKYIGLNLSVQLGAEAAVRYDDIYDPNPAVMAKNLLTNPEVLENVGFMTTETIMMTGVSKSLKTTKAKFMASGAVALTNSSIMNFAIKEETDVKRVALDTAWETLVGNTQVQLDLKALEYFEKMALKKNNPKIKLVGYVLVLVDMGVGYVTYSKLTSKLEETPKLMLVPVLAEKE